MKLTKVKKEEGKVVFEINDLTPAYVNSLRRIFANEVPTMAIQNLEIRKNDSALYDEIIAHRMGLLVLKTDLKSYNLPEKGAEPSAATHVEMVLKAKGPKTVYAEELKSKDPKIKPVHGKTPIVKLGEGQEIELVARACLGYGTEHSKWSTGLVSYYFKPKIEVNNNSKELKDYINKYPKQVVKDGKIDVKLINTPELIDACNGVNEDIVKISYERKHKDFVFTIESWGQLNPEEIVEKGIEVYNNKLGEFEKAISTIK